MKRPPPSLQVRALGWLAQREQSRAELRRKLLRVALRPARGADGEPADDASAEDAATQVDQLLDRLQVQGLLS